MEDLLPDFEQFDSIRDYTRKTLRQPVSKRPTSAVSNLVPQFGLFAGEPMNENDLIMEFTGRIGLQQEYINDPINQYATLQRPKQYVLFSPPNTLNIYVDARLYGNDARYVRRSCFPNARLALVCVFNPPERGIHFGLFATKNIKIREEITIRHDWNLSNKLEDMIASVPNVTKPLLEAYTPESLRSMATYASTVLANEDCACHDDHCTFTRLRKVISTLPEISSRRTSSDTMSTDGMQRSGDDLEGSEMEDDSRPNSRGTQTRDRTPSKDTMGDIVVPKTAREQRKLEQVIARFAQLEEKEKEKSTEKRKKSEDVEDSNLTAKRRRQSSITSESQIRPTTSRTTSSTKGGRGVKRKSMSPSPGVDRISESGASVNESPKPGGRVPNRVKRSMKSRKEPTNKKIRLHPPDQVESKLPKWVMKSTLSESWTPPQMLWLKKYTENARREFEQAQKECKETEIQQVVEKPMESTGSVDVPNATLPLPTDIAPKPKVTPNLRVAMPSQSFPHPSDQTPTSNNFITSASSAQASNSYFTLSGPLTSITPGAPPASPIGTPSTPKLKLSLADYRARRASGMLTPSLSSSDPQSVGEGFVVPPPPPLSQGSKSPDQKPAESPILS
jgi:hypothetical protein